MALYKAGSPYFLFLCVCRWCFSPSIQLDDAVLLILTCPHLLPLGHRLHLYQPLIWPKAKIKKKKVAQVKSDCLVSGHLCHWYPEGVVAIFAMYHMNYYSHVCCETCILCDLAANLQVSFQTGYSSFPSGQCCCCSCGLIHSCEKHSTPSFKSQILMYQDIMKNIYIIKCVWLAALCW